AAVRHQNLGIGHSQECRVSNGSEVRVWQDGSSTAKAFDAKRETDLARQALRAVGIDSPVQYDEVTTSTNDTALVWAERGEPEWSVVLAGHQTGGRGRLGRTWE